MRVRVAPWCLLFAAAAACGGRAPATPPPAIARPVPEVVRLALGARFSCALDDRAEVRCWGDVPFEVAGRAVDERVRTPHAIVGARDVHEIAADDETLCVRTAARHVLCGGEDVRADGARAGLVEVRELRGASSLAVVDARVCALIEDALRCVGPNQARIHDRVAAGSWLEVAGHDVCVLDGAGPARCLAPDATTLWPVTGSEGATSIALARGLCVTTAPGALRCDGAAASPEEASLREIEGTEARLVRGTRERRCVAHAAGVHCDRVDHEGAIDAVDLEGTPVGALSIAEVGVIPFAEPSAVRPWHVCALLGDDVWCAGANAVGEVDGHVPSLVQRIAELPGARDLAVLDGEAIVADASGALVHVPLGHPSARRVDDTVVGVEDLSKCMRTGVSICGRASDARAFFVEGHAVEERPGFAARGQAFPVGSWLCADAEGGVVCAHPSEPTTTVPGLAQGVSFEGRLCGLVGGEIRCSSPPAGSRRISWGWFDPRATELTTLPGSPRDVVRLFGGAEQLFAERRGGTWIVLGHNGVGQLGLPPSRPLIDPAPTSPPPFTAMAFGYHHSCGWAESGGLECAGFDPRTLAPHHVSVSLVGTAVLEGTPVPEDRGDGRWVSIPTVTGVLAFDGDGLASCALDRRGGLWCWGGSEAARAAWTEPTRVALGE